MPPINTSEAAKKVKPPNKERQMYKRHETQELCSACQPHSTTIYVRRLGIQCKLQSPLPRTTKRTNGTVLFGDRNFVYPTVTTQTHDQETE